MKDTKLWQSLEALSGWERNALHRFTVSPYFNQRKDVILLLDYLLVSIQRGGAPSRQQIWKEIFPEEAFDDQRLRLSMSYLQRLTEQFLAVESLFQDPPAVKRRIVRGWREKGATTLHEKALADAERSLERQSNRDADYHFERYLLYQERYRRTYRQRPEKGRDLQPLDKAFNTAFIGRKLRQTCLLLAHDQVYEWGFTPSLLDAVYQYIQANNLLEEPCISIYWHGIRMLQAPEEEMYFRQFKSTLLENSQLFATAEVQDLYLLAINYGVRRVNDGQRSYFYDIMDFYRDGLEQEYLLQNGQLSRFTYHNIVSVALQIGQPDWAEDFIESWTNRLDRRYRERMESFSQAKIAYYRCRYDEALPLLQRANYHDPLLNLGARTLLLKIYYERSEYDALESHLEAFRTYLQRKPELGYHRANYRHLIRFTRKLLSLRPGDRNARNKLRQQILAEEILTEKDWLLAQVKVY